MNHALFWTIVAVLWAVVVLDLFSLGGYTYILNTTRYPSHIFSAILSLIWVSAGASYVYMISSQKNWDFDEEKFVKMFVYFLVILALVLQVSTYFIPYHRRVEMNNIVHGETKEDDVPFTEVEYLYPYEMESGRTDFRQKNRRRQAMEAYNKAKGTNLS